MASSLNIADGDITLGNPTEVAAKVNSTQMGITISFGGINNWAAYLDDQETDNYIDDEDR